MKSVRLGIIGVGGMGGNHARRVLDGSIRNCRLAAVCDTDPTVLNRFPSVDRFGRSEELIRSGRVDAVLIATPHFTHTTVGIDALEQGLHVLVEKPISVHKADCLRLIGAHRSSEQVFAAMFNERTLPHYRHARSLIQNRELGLLFRVHWTITTWFRTQSYFDSGDWRATWAGEGGGLLLNQCPHQLDLLWWLCGMPERIRAFCSFGKRHDIEVEDEVYAYLEYPGGANGLFYASTGELPGTDRLEIVGDNGTIVVEGNAAYFDRLETPTREFIQTSKERFGRPGYERISFPDKGEAGRHREIIQNFVDAILDGAPLIAPADEGLHSVELANAMLYSSLTDRPVNIPLDAAAYEKKLSELVAGSKR
jgi:predicted dehydrogenase